MLRHPEPGCSTAGLLARAIGLALADAGVAPRGGRLGVASFSLRPDRAIDLGWRLGLKLNWCMQDEMGGASAINLLRQAWLRWKPGRPALSCWRPAIISPARIFRLVSDYNRSAREYLSPLGCVGPNPLFAMLTQRQMMRTGLRRETTARCAWRSAMGGRESECRLSPALSLRQYLDAPLVAPPLGRLDCVPVVSGACALVLSARPAGVHVTLRPAARATTAINRKATDWSPASPTSRLRCGPRPASGLKT